MPLPKDVFQVFISHATAADGDLANWIADALDRLHLRAFVYERYQIGSQNKFETIKTAILACPYFLVILTKNGIASQWVNQEIGYAVAVNRAPIPIIEVEVSTGRRIDSHGFVELNDPIDYRRDEILGLMASVVYTFHGLLSGQSTWPRTVFLSCICGNEFEGELKFEQNWHAWQLDPERRPLELDWACAECHRQVTLSFPDCHLMPQEG